MKNYLLVFYSLFLWSLSQSALCQNEGKEENNNITISSRTENYEFVKGTPDHPVLIKEELSTTYKCNGFRTIVPFEELYDDYTSIDELTIYIDGKLSRKITPDYSYFPVNDEFYTDARICYFSLPLEKKNSQSQVVIKKTITDPRYFMSIYFNEDYYLEKKQVSLKVPNWMKLELREYNFPAESIIKKEEQKDNATIYTYMLQNIPVKELPANAPGYTYVYPHLLILSQSARPDGMPPVTYFQTLQNLYDWSYSLVKQINNDPSSFKEAVQDIVKNKLTDEQKIQAVYQWVQANIRYIAFEDAIAAFKPESAQEVYRKKYGDCKGMANLTKEMLKVLGYDARLCWLGTNHIVYDHSTPSLVVNNHMICALLLNGKFIFLDATEKYIGFEEYAERIQGRQVLIEDGEHYIQENVPVVPVTQNTVTGKRVLKIGADNISGTISLNYKGQSKEYLHFKINSIASQKRETAIQQYLSGNNANYKIQDLTVTGLDDWNKDITIQYHLQYNNAISEFGDEKYINVDLRNELADMKIDTLRQVDFWLPYKYHFRDTTELILPDGYTIEQFPKSIYIKNDSWLFNLRYMLSDRKIICTKEIMIMTSIIKKQQFSSWNADVAALNSFYKTQIVLKKN